MKAGKSHTPRCRVALGQGPTPRPVPQMAMADTTLTAVTAPGGPSRHAAQIRKGKRRERSVIVRVAHEPPNPQRLRATRPSRRAPASASCRRGRWTRGGASQRHRHGATTRSPSSSPRHQVRQAWPSLAEGMTPPSQPLVTPRVALTCVLSPAARTTKPTTSRRRASAGRNPTTGCRREAPTTASRVLPSAMPEATRMVAPVDALTRKAPKARPGQPRCPNRVSATSAMPVGGQTAVAKPLTASRESPSWAVLTSMPHHIPMRMMSGMDRACMRKPLAGPRSGLILSPSLPACRLDRGCALLDTVKHVGHRRQLLRITNAGRCRGVMWHVIGAPVARLEGQANSSSSALASCRSAVSKPSVNQP